MMTRIYVIVAFATCVGLVGCRQDMHDQAKYKPFKASKFFEDGRGSRPLLADTVARGQLNDDELLYTGKVNGALASEFPFAMTKEILHRGQERYNIFCSPCHDRVGNGEGMIVQRGYRRPPSLHLDRLRDQQPGYFFDVMTNGFGVMPNYAQQIPVADRWAIAGYVRALQLSQRAMLADVPAADRGQLDAPIAASSAPAAAHGGHHE